MKIHPISLVIATLMLLAVLTQGQETLKAASIVPLAAAAEEAALKVAPAPVCNEVCFDGCTAQQGNITECGVKCHCPEEAEKLTVSLKKQDRCWDQCRQNCVMNMFTGGSSDKPSWTCFADCTCVCNVGCTDSCEKDGVLNQICLSSCGCPADMEQTEKLLERSDKYYELPLDPRTDEQMNAAFEGKLADILDGEATHKANKQKKILKKSLRKIKYKWDEYVENAKSLGLDPTVFCDQTCSDQCFQNSNAAEVSIYEILTTCLISECKCFQPKLPYASDKVSFEGLLTLKGFINDQILEDTPVQPIVQPIAPVQPTVQPSAPVLPATPVHPSVQPTAPVQPATPVQPIVQPTIPVQPTAQSVAPITEPTIQPSAPADATVHSTPAPLPASTTTAEVPAQTTHETPSESGEVKTESGPAAPSPTPATEVTPPVVEPTPTAPIPATEPAYAPTPVTPEAPPAPAAEPTPAPAAEPTPAPAVEPTPAPAVEPTPAPVVEPTPAPATEPAPTPATEPAPTPATEPAPTPATEPAPTPATEPAPTPAPVVEPTPAPAAEPTPAPVSEPTPAAEPTPTPAPATEEAPTPAPAAEPTPVPAPSADETPVPAPAPEAATPTQDPVPASPITPETPATTPEAPATTPEAPATTPEISEIHATPLEAGVECNLTCFSECLELKKLSPYPVIQQCVETRCHCAIDESSQKIDAVQQMVGLAAVDAVAPTGSAWGSFLRFLVSIIIIAFIFATAFIAYMVYGRKENGVFGKIGQFKNKAQNYGSMFKGSKNDSDEWGYREHDAYERLT